MKAAGLDGVITYKLGEYDGADAEFPSGEGTSLMCLVTDFTYDPTVAVLPVTALCDANAVKQPGIGDGRVTFNAQVPIGGSLFVPGLPILFSFKTDASVSVAKSLPGFIASAPIILTVGAIQTQSVTVELGINYTTAS